MAATARPSLASLEGEFNEEAMPKRKDLLRGENETCWHVTNEKKHGTESDGTDPHMLTSFGLQQRSIISLAAASNEKVTTGHAEWCSKNHP